MLIAVALVVHQRSSTASEGLTATESLKAARTQALLERLGRLGFLTTVGAGVLLGIVGPKRLVLTFFCHDDRRCWPRRSRTTATCRCVRHARDRARVGSVGLVLVPRRTCHRAHTRARRTKSLADSRRSPSTHSWYSPRSSSPTQSPFCLLEAGVHQTARVSRAAVPRSRVPPPARYLRFEARRPASGTKRLRGDAPR